MAGPPGACVSCSQWPRGSEKSAGLVFEGHTWAAATAEMNSLPVLEAGSPRSGVGRATPAEAWLLGVWTAVFSLYPHMAVPLHIHVLIT